MGWEESVGKIIGTIVTTALVSTLTAYSVHIQTMNTQKAKNQEKLGQVALDIAVSLSKKKECDK